MYGSVIGGVVVRGEIGKQAATGSATSSGATREWANGPFFVAELIMQTVDKLRGLLEPAVESLGYELLHIEFAGSGGSILRLYIDAPGGIEVDDCETVSRQVSLIMDVEDPLANAYTLEVSSPGLDRPLVTPAHFRRFQKEQVRIVMYTHVMGRRRFTGHVTEVSDDMVVLEADGESYELPYADMDSARVDPVFPDTSPAGGKRGARKGQRS